MGQQRFNSAFSTVPVNTGFANRWCLHISPPMQLVSAEFSRTAQDRADHGRPLHQHLVHSALLTLDLWLCAAFALRGTPAAASCRASTALRRSPLAPSAVRDSRSASSCRPVAPAIVFRAFSMLGFVTGLKVIWVAPAASIAAAISYSTLAP